MKFHDFVARPTAWTGRARRGALAMSHLGHKRTLQCILVMSTLPPKADIGLGCRDVRFVPKADIILYILFRPYHFNNKGWFRV